MNPSNAKEKTQRQIEEALQKTWSKMTSKQRYAVEVAPKAQRDILVSAAAGSGKTFVLVQRIVALLLLYEKDIRKMLLATFTNAAAAQMQKRIQSAISELIYTEQINSPHLKEQLMYLNGADISTLHAFCMKMIRSYFHILDIAPDFTILQGAEEVLLREETMREVLEFFLSREDEAFLAVYEMYTPFRKPLAMGDMILEIYDYAMSRPEGLGWLQDEIEYYDKAKDLTKSKWVQFLTVTVEQLLDEALHLQSRAMEWAEPVLPKEKQEILLGEQRQFQDLADALQRGWDSFQREYDLAVNRGTATLRFPKETDIQTKEQVKRYREAAREILKKELRLWGTYSVQKAEKENEKLLDVLKCLKEMTQSFAEEYKKRKAKKKAITFHDCEQLCLQILKDENISREIKDQYEYIFIDEYQDISMLQEAILKNLSTGSNLFMVGDIKQSIYRFRLADADIFREKYERFQQKEENGEVIHLNQNFRSAQSVINGINAVFEPIMRKQTGGVDYDEHAKLVFARKDLEATVKTEIHLFCSDKQDAAEDEDVFAELESAQKEALGTATTIKSLLQQEIFDKKEQKMRKMRYGDIVVLLASPSTDAAGYVEIFRQQKIPLFFDAGKGYFDNMEVDLVMNLLTVIDNDQQDIALLAVMRSLLFGFDLAELLQIRQHTKQYFFYEAIDEYRRCFTDALSEKLHALYRFIESCREKSKHIGIYDLLLDIYDETGLCDYVAMMEGGRLRSENLHSLLHIAREYEKGTMQGVFGFIRFVEKVKAAQTDIGAPLLFIQRQNAVRMMSIHKSKGLEFPVVILGRTSKRFNRADLRKELILHKHMGVGITYCDVENGYKCDSLAKIAAKEAVKNDITSEQMRLLYVALSRAEERLIITGLVSEKTAEKKMASWSEKISTYQVQRTVTFLDWIMSAAMQEGVPKDKSAFDVTLHSDLLLQEKDEMQMERKAVLNYLNQDAQPLTKEEIRRLLWRYPYEASTQIAQKITVSELKQAGQPATKKYADFAAEEENNILPMRRGLIVHYLMETIDLEMLKKTNRYEEIIKEYLNRLIAEKIISKQEAQAIETDKLADFWTSEAGQIILQAERVQREVEFYYRANAKEVYENMCLDSGEHVYIQGIIDCVATYQGVDYIIDYKTDYYRPESRKERIAPYRTQLRYYQKAYEAITKTRNTIGILCFINMGENIIVGTAGDADE